MRALLPPRRRPEPTIGLINVVFLMLIFFLIAGTIASAPEPEMRLVSLAGIEARAPQDALVLMADGRLRHGGQQADLPAYLASLPEPRIARLLPDRDAPATRLLEVARSLREQGAERVLVLTERALP
ncbi:MAG: ExbD/TolR family protein [Pararhodobacter sp.]